MVLVHAKSGLSVRCQEERTQGMNRFLARRRLVEKLEELKLGADSARQQAFEKIRRTKRKRSKRAKERILESKHRRASTKSLRRGGFDD